MHDRHENWAKLSQFSCLEADPRRPNIRRNKVQSARLHYSCKSTKHRLPEDPAVNKSVRVSYIWYMFLLYIVCIIFYFVLFLSPSGRLMRSNWSTAQLLQLHFFYEMTTFLFLVKPANKMNTSHPDWAPLLHLGHTEIWEKGIKKTAMDWQ